MGTETRIRLPAGRRIWLVTIETADGERRPVTLARVEGIDPSRAVAIPAMGTRTIYLAEGQCYVDYANGGFQDLLACLREGTP
jgi:hypothetical protein